MSPGDDKKWTKTRNFVERTDDRTDLQIMMDWIQRKILQRGLPVILKIEVRMFDTVCEKCGCELNKDNISTYKGVAMCKECKAAPKEWPTVDKEAEKQIDFTNK